MNILKLARIPAVTIKPSASVMQSILLMQQERVGALFVVEHGKLLGALSERDIVFRVVLRRRDPETTSVRKVMTSPAVSLAADATVAEAIRVMATHGVRRLPIVSDGSVKGMVSLRHMLRERALDLTEEMDSLVAELCADGIGG